MYFVDSVVRTQPGLKLRTRLDSAVRRPFRRLLDNEPNLNEIISAMYSNVLNLPYSPYGF